MIYNSILGKKLSDAMKFFDEETVFHVGAETSFFFVGTKSEFEKDKLMISNKYIDRHRDLIERNQKRIRKEVSRITDQNASKKIIKDCICNLRRFNNAIDKSENYIKTFVPFESRKVIKIYERSQKDGIVMIVEGNEVGGFWDKEEYERGAAL